MIHFIIKNKIIIVSILVLFFLLTLFQKNIKTDRDYNFIDKIIISLFASPLQITSSVKNTVSGFWHRYIFLVDLNEKLLTLEQRTQALELENQMLREKYAENQRLRALLELQERYTFKMMPAEIIGRDPSTWFNTLIINRGKKHGVEIDSGIIAPHGVVGKVVSVSNSTAQVLAITDVNSSLDVILRTSQSRAILEGYKGETCKLNFVLKTEDVQIGGEVITSGLHGIFPKGLLVGTVSAVEKDARGFFQFVQIEPSVEISKINEVMIILKEETF